jgi:AI-2 transport protein TqsA
MVAREKRPDMGARVLLVTASLVVVIAGMRAASTVLLPLIVSVFIATLSLPLLFWLRGRKVPAVLATILTLSADIAVLVGVGYLVKGSADEFVEQLPKYQSRLEEMARGGVAWLEARGVPASHWRPLELVNPSAFVSVAQSTLDGLTTILSHAVLVLLTTTFILFEAAAFPAKLRAAFAGRGFDPSKFGAVIREVRQYVAIKTLVSLATGLLATFSLALLGVDFPLLWGLVAFILNFIPNLGSILAAIPPVLLALVQFGFGRAVGVMVCYFAINMLLGNIVEPHLMGRRLGLSTLVVFLSLVFWGWVWGPVGMLLSVPLTMIVKILLENTEDLRWIAVLLGPAPPSPPKDKREQSA